jgi:hypothetical protein
MLYIWTLDSHFLLGPFTTRAKAHAYAKKHGYTSYQIRADAVAQQRNIHQTLTLVPTEDR